ncbi:hypothetical protein Celaphus_00014086, partial [Cervus elaphus hippelaphus]
MDGSPREGALRALPGAGSLLLLLVLAVHSPPSRGLKYGIRAVDLKSIETVLESGFFSRISSWRNSTVGGHPWQVSLKLDGHHFCGGSLIQDDLVVTAVHCLISLNEKQIKSLTVTAGEYNLFQKDEEEQNIPVSKVIIHPEYNRLGYMSFNIALLYLKLKVKFGTTVQPICIPHRGDKFEEGILCMASGWGKTSETSEYSNILQEVEVPIMDDRTCGTLLRGMNLPPLGRDVLRDDGAWVLAGITSWAAGCTRVWNPFRNKQRKVSPGIFSKVFVLMDFITQTMIGPRAAENSVLSLPPSFPPSIFPSLHPFPPPLFPHFIPPSFHPSLPPSFPPPSFPPIVPPTRSFPPLLLPSLPPSPIPSKCVLFIAMTTGRTCLLVAILFSFHHLEEKVKRVFKQNWINIISPNQSCIFCKSVCGIPPFNHQWLSRRIAGGIEACPHCWPWQVGLRFLGNHQCGGAIINSIWILTAAH